MDWLNPYLYILNYYAMIVTIATSGVPRFSWKGTLNFGSKGVIYFLRSRLMIERWCLYYLAHAHDTSVTLPPPMDSTWIVYKFIDVFRMDLIFMPPDHESNFAIDVKPGTKPILFLPTGWS